eukprot:scaffold18107_cov57-Phaeocystis_antarctica.AAC.2
MAACSGSGSGSGSVVRVRVGARVRVRVRAGRQAARPRAWRRMLGDACLLGLELRRARVAHDTRLAPDGGESLVGVVRAEQQPPLGTRGEHAVRLHGAARHLVRLRVRVRVRIRVRVRVRVPARHQVVDQHADVPLVPPHGERRPPRAREPRVDAGDEAETRRLLVARRAWVRGARGTDDLPRQVEAAAAAHLERVVEAARVDIVVLDVVGRLEDLRLRSG